MTAGADARARYLLNGGDEDLNRLLDISALLSATTRTALVTVDIRPGWRVLECGCGPLGAMPILADLVGPSGHVVGVDVAAPAVARARCAVAELGLRNVEVRVADINDPATDLGGPYDLAFTRCFLMHQHDPLHTLTRIRDTLRPDGWLVALEPLPSPPPFSHPPDADLRAAWDLLNKAIHRAGASPTATAELPATAERAGFDVVQVGGSFQPADPATGYRLHAATTGVAREAIIASGVASARAVDALIDRLQTAGTRQHGGWVTSPLSLTMTLRNRAIGSDGQRSGRRRFAEVIAG